MVPTDRAVDFSFIYDLCAPPLYCADNGRPAIDPEILFRMLLVTLRDQVRGAAGQLQHRLQVVFADWI